MRFWQLLAVSVLLACSTYALHAQAVGDEVANKVFLNSWNTPGGFNEVTDYRGSVLLLDWFGTT
ncbi:MAG: hypothetical protein IT464_07170 [Planctomycetes bacterium]|nr:hypothetical protein [Planctomycetota bacterium]